MFNISFLTYIFLIIGFVSGHFKKMLLYMLLIIFHELGHFTMAKLLNWKLDKIYIYPLGGITKYADSINKPFIEEILVTIMGPIFQIILSLILVKYEPSLDYFNKLLLYFNLLPIVPLDGSKILISFLNLFEPYKKTLKYIIKISYLLFFIAITISIFNINSFFILLVLFLLIFKIKEESDKNDYYFNKFLLERYLHNFNFKKDSLINNINQMYKYKRNVLIRKKRLLDEKELLKEYFN